MKKQVMVLLLAAGSVMAVSAEATEDRASRFEGRAMMHTEDRGEVGGRMGHFMEDADITTVTGKVKLVNGEAATIVDKGVTYTVRAPWNELVNLELTDGQSVTFKGVEMQPREQWDGTEKNLMLTAAIIGDKEITIDYSSEERRGGRRPEECDHAES